MNLWRLRIKRVLLDYWDRFFPEYCVLVDDGELRCVKPRIRGSNKASDTAHALWAAARRIGSPGNYWYHPTKMCPYHGTKECAMKIARP